MVNHFTLDKCLTDVFIVRASKWGRNLYALYIRWRIYGDVITFVAQLHRN